MLTYFIVYVCSMTASVSASKVVEVATAAAVETTTGATLTAAVYVSISSSVSHLLGLDRQRVCHVVCC